MLLLIFDLLIFSCPNNNFCHREKETAILKEQINKLQSAISREEEKAKDLKLKAQ